MPVEFDDDNKWILYVIVGFVICLCLVTPFVILLMILIVGGGSKDNDDEDYVIE